MFSNEITVSTIGTIATLIHLMQLCMMYDVGILHIHVILFSSYPVFFFSTTSDPCIPLSMLSSSCRSVIADSEGPRDCDDHHFPTTWRHAQRCDHVDGA